MGPLRTMAGNLNGPARQAVLNVIAQLKDLGRQNPRPDVDVDTRAALAGIGVVQGRLNDLDGNSATVRIYQDTIHRVYRVPGGGRIPIDSADGGYISGPGGPRDDLIPANPSYGGYVVRADAVAKYGRQMFDRLNAMSFAQGGYVSLVQVTTRHPVTVTPTPVVGGGLTINGNIITQDAGRSFAG